jgi:hypothetical protein
MVAGCHLYPISACTHSATAAIASGAQRNPIVAHASAYRSGFYPRAHGSPNPWPSPTPDLGSGNISGQVVSKTGGEGGIRTPDGLAPMPHFECGAFNHSATSPRSWSALRARALDSGWACGRQGPISRRETPSPRLGRAPRPAYLGRSAGGSGGSYTGNAGRLVYGRLGI